MTKFFFFLFFAFVSTDILGQLYYDQLPSKPADKRIIERTKFFYNLKKEDSVSGDTLILLPSHDCDFKSGQLISREIFNQNGLLIQKEGFFPCPLYDTTRYEYDEVGRLTKILESTDKYSIAYNDNKNLVYMQAQSDTSLYFIRVKAFDKKGRLKSVRDFSEDTLGQPEATYSLSYSKGDRKVKQKFNIDYSKGAVFWFYSNKKGNLLKEIWPSSDSISNYLEVKYLTYNSNNLLSEERVFKEIRFSRKRQLLEKISYVYNIDGKVQKEIYSKYLSPEVEKITSKEYFYRLDGLLDYEIYTNENGEPTTKYQYEYKFR